MRLVHRLVAKKGIGGLPGGVPLSNLYLPLTSTLVPTRGASTPTFTRATVAWDFDSEGKLNPNIPAGCPRFTGARFVRNSVATTSATLAVAASNTVTLARSETVTFSMGAGAGTATFSGTSGATGTLTASAGGRTQVTKTCTAGTFIITASVADLVDIQVEAVTGQADQTASEYVSVGVLSSPYHGAGVDGCKYFTTNKDGSAIPAATLKGYYAEPSRVNNLFYSRGVLAGAKAGKWIPSVTGSAVLADNFSTYADTAAMLAAGWTATNSVPTLQSGKIRVATQTNTVQAYASKSFATTIGKTYVIAAELVTDASTAAIYIGVGSSAINVSDAARSVTATGLCYLTFVASASTSHLTLFNGGTSSVAGEYAEWDNITISEAAIVPTDTATGLDNVANSASRLTAAAADATLLQLLTAATGTRTTSAWIKRVSGSGTVSLTRNGGTGWTDITSSLVTGTWVPVALTSDVGANPTVGLKMGTSGDVIDVDCFQDENGAWRTSPILTTTAAVTRNADVLSYASAFDVAQGTAFCSCSSASPINTGDVYILSGDSNGGLLYINNPNARNETYAYDGTNIAGQTTGSSLNTGARKRAVRWGGTMRLCADGLLGGSSAFDGSMGAASRVYVGSTSGGGSQLAGNIGEVHVWNTPLTDAQMQQVTS